MPVELKDPRPAPLYRDESGEKLRLWGHTTTGYGNGPAGATADKKRNGLIAAHSRLDNYPQISEKSGYDLSSETDLAWGDFQNYFLSADIMSVWRGCLVKS
jgi:hypothetical protein